MPRCLPGEWKPATVLCGLGSHAGPQRRGGIDKRETVQPEAEDGHGASEERRGDAPGEGCQETRGLARVSFGSRGTIIWRRSLCFQNVRGMRLGHSW